MWVPDHVLYPLSFALLFAIVAALLTRRFVLWLQHPTDKKSSKRPKRLLSIHEVDEHLRGNLFVTEGYRSPDPDIIRFGVVFFFFFFFFSLVQLSICIRSIFELHNETFNVWSHLLGAVYFFGLTVNSVFHALVEEEEIVHRITVVFFLIGATTLCSASALFHAVSCHSREVWSKEFCLFFSF